MAEQKKSKVLSCEFQREWTGQFGVNYSHLVRFENGDSGQANFKSKGDSYFQVGKVVDYILEQTTRQDGVTKDWKIGKVRTGGFGGFGGGATKGIKEYKAEAVLVAAKIASNASLMKEGVKFDDVYPIMEKKLFDRLTEVFK